MVDIGQKLDDTYLQELEDQTQRIILWLSTVPFREQHVAGSLTMRQSETGSMARSACCSVQVYVSSFLSYLCIHLPNRC